MTSSTSSLSGRDFVSLADVSSEELEGLLAGAARAKAELPRLGEALRGRAVILLFEKPSLRTRVSFEVGVSKLGGSAHYFDHAQQRIGQRESIADYGRNLERWVDAIVARTYSHETIERLADAARVPVINALSEREHPCQALADMLTLREHLARRGKSLRGARLAYLGDANNVCHALLVASAKLGVNFAAVTPPACAPRPEALAQAQAWARDSGATVLATKDVAAVEGADAIYTDVWTSMGAEVPGEEAMAKRRALFRPYRVNAALMQRAGPQSLFMHCLPANRGIEVTDDVIDSPASVVYDQAENRMHTQNALLLQLLARE